MVENWKCICGIKWHNCAQHRQCTNIKAKIHTSIVADDILLSEPAASGRKRKGSSLGKPGLGFHELLESDTREDARKQRILSDGSTEVSLGTYLHKIVKPGFLGTKLKMRFSRSRIVRN